MLERGKIADSQEIDVVHVAYVLVTTMYTAQAVVITTAAAVVVVQSRAKQEKQVASEDAE